MKADWDDRHTPDFMTPKLKKLSVIQLATILGWMSLATTACAQESAPPPPNNQSIPKQLIKNTNTVTDTPKPQTETNPAQDSSQDKKLETITLGGGCFWCVEAVFQRIQGIEKWTSGYMGGKSKNPTYEEVCTGFSGHAEIVQLEFDPEVISLDQVLQVFWRAHDPTTLNRQGADVGTQYRSVIFYSSEKQKSIALESKAEAEAEKLYNKPIMTEISPASEFYPAEGYHQNYFNLNPSRGYCQAVIWPKLKKLGLPLKIGTN